MGLTFIYAHIFEWKVFQSLPLRFVFLFFFTRPHTPPIKDDWGKIIPESITLLEKVELGDLEQWICIRGKDRSYPVVLFLHGGPGMPMMYLAHKFQRPMEEGTQLLNAIQNVYLCKEVTIA